MRGVPSPTDPVTEVLLRTELLIRSFAGCFRGRVELVESLRDRALPEDRISDLRLERPAVPIIELPEHKRDLTEQELEHPQLVSQDPENPVLDRSRAVEVRYMDVAVLVQAIDSSDPLLDLHRVPRQVVVHYAVGELEVQSLCSSVGRYEHLCSFPERLERSSARIL